jgi:hypothetical protein
MTGLAFFNIILVLVGAAIAGFEHRLSKRQMGYFSVPWLVHGGMWSDLIIVSGIAYLIGSYLGEITTTVWVMCIVAGLAISVLMHLAYCQWCDLPGHIVEPERIGIRKLTVGGWYHLAYFTVVLGTLSAYFIDTSANKFWVAVLLICFIPVAVWQPGWYAHKLTAGRGHIDANGWLQGLVMIVVICTAFWVFTPTDYNLKVIKDNSQPVLQATETKWPWLITPFNDQGLATIDGFTVIRHWQNGDHIYSSAAPPGAEGTYLFHLVPRQ